MIAKTVFLSLLISLSLLTATAPESGGGLLFHGLERPIDERSSLVIKPGTASPSTFFSNPTRLTLTARYCA